MPDARSSIPGRLRPAIAILLSAFDYADDVGISRWQFAVDTSELMSTGATVTDLRWLVLKRFAEAALEVTIPGDRDRVFRELPALSFQADSCLVLNSSGASFLRPIVESSELQLSIGSQTSAARPMSTASGRDAPHPVAMSDQTAPDIKPIWDPELHELRLGNDVVKRFSRPATAQAAILSSLQDDGWPAAIDDPLSPQAGQDPKRRLHYTIRNLNRGQHPLRIRFYINGSGETIRWLIVPSSSAPVARRWRTSVRRKRKSPRPQ